MRSFRTYQLNDAAARLSDMLKFTRFESGTPEQASQIPDANERDWLARRTDSNGNGTIDATDKQQLIASFATLLPSGVAPSPTAITTALGAQLSHEVR